MKNLIWTEKYRPNKFEEWIGDSSQVKELIKEPLSMPHFLFVSKSPGTGKTSLAYVIKNEIDCDDFLITNSSDERKIEFIRTIIKNFALTQRTKKNVPRIVLMDEIDGMLSTSQEALRHLMEKYSGNCKFILTANNEEKIIEPIKSRCVVVRLKEIDREEIFKRITKIMLLEQIQAEKEAIEKVIDIHYPDMRQMINHLQELAPNITLERVKTKMELEDEYYKLLRKRQPLEARKFFIAKALDPQDTLKRVLENVLTKTDIVVPNTDSGILNDKQVLQMKENIENKIPQTIFLIAETNYKMALGADPEIQMFSFALKFCDLWR